MAKIDLISPIDGSIYISREVLGRETAFACARQAKSAQSAWASRPLAERIELVLKANQIVGETTDQMAIELAHQMGRPVRYGGEYGGFDERVRYMADVATECLSPDIIEYSPSFRRMIKREPHGVCLVVAPWNYPYMTAINTIAPALIAGNTVVLKHAAQTLQVGERLVEAFHAAGVPQEVIQNIVIDHETTSALIGERAVDFVNFTGSVAGGQAMEQAAAGTFVPVSTELGGKDPAYVRSDANLDTAVDTLMDGAMFNSGQCCCGIERIYVHHNLFDDFVEKSVNWVNSQALGNPLDQTTTLGPMANIRFSNEVRAQVAEALADGAHAHIPRMAADDDINTYVTPQVLTKVTHDMRVMRDETFGPVVGIMPVATDDEAVALMNDCRFGLTASIWTADFEVAASLGDRLETGTVFMNRCDYLDPALCWTGCKDTGRGQGLSKLAYHALTRPKSFHLRS